jgi:hypothetical protein
VTDLFLPGSAIRDLEETRRRHSAEVKDCVVLDREWTRLLKQVDDKLYMVRSRHWVKTGLPLVPGGCWHIVRDNSDKGAPETIIPLFENGEMLEPGSWVFDMLRRNDLQRPGALKERQRQVELLEEAQERQRRRERENRQQEILERWKAGDRAFVGWTPEGKWTQSARAKGK